MILAFALLLAPTAAAKKFYDDDPLQAEPRPMHVQNPLGRKLSDYYDFFLYTLTHAGERQTKTKVVPARAVNTLGEAPDSAWYTKRHYWKPMTTEELVRGPGNSSAPSQEGPWKVVAAKTEGITPGFRIADSKGRQYILKFDPLTNPEIATSADVISSKFFYALGYNVPENYVVSMRREQLVLGEDIVVRDASGKRRTMTDREVTETLMNVPRNRDGTYRAVASLTLAGEPLGPFRYHGTRKDDPNDTVLHEHRRDLRGLGVFCAWLDHDDSRSINTLDELVKEDGVQFIKHHLVDFGSTLGSASNGPNSPRSGFEYLFAWKTAAPQFFTFGLLVPRWARARFSKLPSVGRFEGEYFDAERWVPEYLNPAFANRLPDDGFWAAKQVMAFTDEQIRAIVQTGEYSDPAAEKWIVDSLIARRDKIGKAFFAKLLPLDRFSVKDGQLQFEDLGVKHGLLPAHKYTVRWSRFNNETGEKTALPSANTFAVPQEPRSAPGTAYCSAEIRGEDPKKAVTVYVRSRGGQVDVVGIDRTW